MANTAVFINEIHYDNASTDTGESIEIAGPAGTDLMGWTLLLYNGQDGLVYSTINLSGTIANQDDGFGTLAFALPTNGLQNGSPDGIALVGPGSNVVQFLSYEGAFVAIDGAASGMTSTDIGVSESGTEAAGQSLQLSGSGRYYEEFTWSAPSTATAGVVNAGQNFTPSIQYAVLQFPSTISVEAGVVSDTIYGRVYQAGYTEAAGASADIVAQLGYGPHGSDPFGNAAWQWVNASFNTQYGNDDEYQATLTIPTIGSYAYTYRFAVIANGIQSDWTYADLDGSGSNPGLSFNIMLLGGLTGSYHPIEGDAGNNILLGTGAADQISGFEGNDRLNGGGGNDYLIGGIGNDTMTGGTGHDTLDGGDGIDTASYLSAATAVIVDLAKLLPQVTAGAGKDTLSGIENLIGSNYEDTLHGDTGANRLDGRGGADKMRGREGNDTYIVDNGGDVVIEYADGGTDVVNASVDNALTINVENLTLTGTGNLAGTGNSLANRITGNSGDNTLDGKTGDDTILGGAGADRIIGGPGRDVMYAGVDLITDAFVFRTVAESGLGAGRDLIFDFHSSEDLIDLQLIDANANLAGNQTFAFSETGPAANAVWFVDVGAHMLIRADVNGDAIRDFEFQLQNVDQVMDINFLL